MSAESVRESLMNYSGRSVPELLTSMFTAQGGQVAKSEARLMATPDTTIETANFPHALAVGLAGADANPTASLLLRLN